MQTLREKRHEQEKAILLTTLNKTGSVAEAARQLGVSRPAVHGMIIRHGLVKANTWVVKDAA